MVNRPYKHHHEIDAGNHERNVCIGTCIRCQLDLHARLGPAAGGTKRLVYYEASAGP